jgi:hypothetical protein
MRKSQIHMGENVAILFIFFILLAVSVVFYARVSETRIGIKQEEAFASKAIEIAQRVSYLAETQCSKDNVIEENCYDLHKLLGMEAANAESAKNRAHYFSMFSFSNITVTTVFPEGGGDVTIYENVKEDFIEKSQVQIPIAVCDYTRIPEKCFFSIMIVDIYR